MQAAERWDPKRGVKFETFAKRRIVGAAIDQLRKQVYHRHARTLRHKAILDCDNDNDIRLSELHAGSDFQDQKVMEVRKQLLDELKMKFHRRTAEMAVLYWFDRVTMKIIGEMYCITESRVSQILKRMRYNVRQLIEIIVRQQV